MSKISLKTSRTLSFCYLAINQRINLLDPGKILFKINLLALPKTLLSAKLFIKPSWCQDLKHNVKWIAQSFRPTTVCCFIWCSVSKWKTIPHVGQLTRHKTIYFSLLLPVVCRPCFPLGCQGCWRSCSWKSASGPHVWLLLDVIYGLKDCNNVALQWALSINCDANLLNSLFDFFLTCFKVEKCFPHCGMWMFIMINGHWGLRVTIK